MTQVDILDELKEGNFVLSPCEEHVLENLFGPDILLVLIEKEFNQGRSEARVLKVSLSRMGAVNRIRTIVKLGPKGLIKQELCAYRKYMRGNSAFISRLEHVYPPEDNEDNEEWGGLSFQLAGEDIFEFEDFLDYCQRQEITTEDILYTLDEYFFPALHKLYELRCSAELHMRASYGRILPVDLEIKPDERERRTVASEEQTYRNISSSSTSLDELTAGEQVSLHDYVVAEISKNAPSKNEGNQSTYSITVETPSKSFKLPSYRIRLNPVSDSSPYHIRQKIPPVQGTVVKTQIDSLFEKANEAFKKEDHCETSSLSFAFSDDSSKKVPFDHETLLPNPFAHVRRIIGSIREKPAWIGKVFGDLNVHNILILPGPRSLIFIDFASAREDHILHDFVRVERGIVTELVPSLISKPTVLHQFYRNLDNVCTNKRESTGEDWIEPALEKPFRIIEALRKESREYLADRSCYTEYYECLFLHLLGCLKHDDLNNKKIPNAKKLAVIGAASLVTLLSEDESDYLPPQEMWACIDELIAENKPKTWRRDIVTSICLSSSEEINEPLKIRVSSSAPTPRYIDVKAVDLTQLKLTSWYDDVKPLLLKNSWPEDRNSWPHSRHVWSSQRICLDREFHYVDGRVERFEHPDIASVFLLKHEAKETNRTESILILITKQ